MNHNSANHSFDEKSFDNFLSGGFVNINAIVKKTNQR